MLLSEFLSEVVVQIFFFLFLLIKDSETNANQESNETYVFVKGNKEREIIF